MVLDLRRASGTEGQGSGGERLGVGGGTEQYGFILLYSVIFLSV